MSVRTRLAGAVAVVATASVALTLLPGTANAATHAPAANPLTIKATPAQPGPLLPGGKAKSFDVTVTNHSGKSVAFEGALDGAANGAIPMNQGDAKVSVQALHAPATASMFGSQDGGFIGAFYPKSGHWGSKFKIPAHSSYTWKVTVAAGKSFPINDDRLEIAVGAADGKFFAFRSTAFHVGPMSLHSGGPIVTKVSGGDKVNVTRPLVLDVRWTNKTGVALGSTLTPWVEENGPLRSVDLAFDVWHGKRWVPLGVRSAALKDVRAGLANGASVTERIRVRIVGRADQAIMGPVTLAFAYDGFEVWTTKVVQTTNQ